MPYNVLDPNWPISNNLVDDQGGSLSADHPRYNERLYGLLKWTRNGWSRENNYRFGMYGVAEFYQPVGGQVNGEDMIFEFTGDDDMVVYIDGVLVLDLGGVHDAQSGYINFANGEVGYTDQKTDDPVHWADKTNIFDQFDAAQSKERTSWKKDTKTFADGSKHKIQFFYMERGKGASNLKIKVNIPPIPDGSVNIQKLVDGLNETQAAKESYTLKLQMKARGAAEFSDATHQAYTLTSTGSGKTYYTDDVDGTFTIHGTDTAIFANIKKDTQIKVIEPDPGRIYKVDYKAYDANNKEITGDIKVPSAGYVDVKVTNKAGNNPKSLIIVKKFEVNGQDAENAPDAEKFKNATFTLMQKGENKTEYETLYQNSKFSSFKKADGSNYYTYTFEKLDPTKTYKVVENITSETNGENSTTRYVGTAYAIGDVTEETAWTTGTESGAISLQTLKADGTYDYHDNTVTFVNKYKSPSVDVEFTKVDAADTTKGLAGAVFALYTDENATKPYKKNSAEVTATSDKDGKVTFTELPYDTKTGATYYMKEIQAPSGYVLDNRTIYKISIVVTGTEVTSSISKSDGSVINDKKIKNAAMQITFFKKAAGGNTFLTGAVFELTKKDAEGNYHQFTDTSTGVDSKGWFTILEDGIKLTLLPDGKYEIREVTAPAGYNLLTQKIGFTITDGKLQETTQNNIDGIVAFGEDGKTITIYNTVGIQLPETGGMGTLMTTMSGMALMLIALGYLILVKRREKGGLN